MNIYFLVCYFLIGASTTLGFVLMGLNRLDKKMYPIVFAVLSAAIELALSYYCAHRFRNNLHVHYYFNLIEYSCFAWFFYIAINKKSIRRFIKVTITLYSIIIVTYSYSFFKADPFSENLTLGYFCAGRDFILTCLGIAYFKNLFDQITQFKKLDVLSVIIASAILFYFTFSGLYNLSFNYLIIYSIKKHISLYDMFNAQNVASQYASQQLYKLQPLLWITNILLYLCIFVALINIALTSKKSINI